VRRDHFFIGRGAGIDLLHVLERRKAQRADVAVGQQDPLRSEGVIATEVIETTEVAYRNEGNRFGAYGRSSVSGSMYG
jgi:hypothetical protein